MPPPSFFLLPLWWHRRGRTDAASVGASAGASLLLLPPLGGSCGRGRADAAPVGPCGGGGADRATATTSSSAWFVGRPSNCCEAGPSGSRERERQFRDDYNDDFGKARRLRWRRPLSGLVVPARSVLAATQMPGEAAGWFRDTADAVENFFWALEHILSLSGDQLYRMDYMKLMQEDIGTIRLFFDANMALCEEEALDVLQEGH
uniref:glucose-1-phosphate adenylyltransferase n=1 Tax=Oryza rufipogon TaxID=4529 RepID=A0A0E0R5G0_ORYRU